MDSSGGIYDSYLFGEFPDWHSYGSTLGPSQSLAAPDAGCDPEIVPEQPLLLPKHEPSVSELAPAPATSIADYSHVVTSGQAPIFPSFAWSDANTSYLDALDGPMGAVTLYSLAQQPLLSPDSLLDSGLLEAQAPISHGISSFGPLNHFFGPLPSSNAGPTLEYSQESTDVLPNELIKTQPEQQESLPTIVDDNLSFSATHHALSATPASSYEDDRRSSSVSTDCSVQEPAAPPPQPSPHGKTPLPNTEAQSPGFIHYRPGPVLDRRSCKREFVSDDETPSGSLPHTIREQSMEDGRGALLGTMITFAHHPPKKRSPYNEKKKQETALARREGVCNRCKKHKRKCDLAQKNNPYVSCTVCLTTKIYKNVARMPCFKSNLTDILFFRRGPAHNEPLYTNQHKLYDLMDITMNDAPVKTVKLTQNIGQHYLTVYAAEFDPSPGYVVSYKWKDAMDRQHETPMPHYCLTNIPKVQNHFKRYIEDAKWDYLRSLKDEDQLAWMTISMAMSYANSKQNSRDSLVAIALDLWATCRMIEIPWEICGHETLGVRIDDEADPRYGKIPIPPTMDTQLDQIVIKHVLEPLRKKLVAKLEEKISPPKPETWFETYLTAFILLSHIERLAKHSESHARLHTMRTKYSNNSFLEAVFHTAKIILSRFHFVCNGSVPFQLDWKSEQASSMARLDPQQAQFMEKTQQLIKHKKHYVLELRSKHVYEQSLYWTHQLFFEDWDNSPSCVIEVN